MADDNATPTRVAGAIAVFDEPGKLVEAARKVREAGFKKFDAHTPYPMHALDEAMGIRRTILPVLVWCGGFTGLITAVVMQWWMNAVDYPFIISGKPEWSLPANVPVMFELTVLFSALTTFFGVLGLNWLPEFYHWVMGSKKFKVATDAGFILSVDANDPRFDKDGTPRFLEEAGAGEVEVIEELATHPAPPKFLAYALVALVVASFIPLAAAGAKRHLRADLPPVHIFPDMDHQPKFKAQAENRFYADDRAMRAPIPGTLAVGAVVEPTVLTTGLEADREDPSKEGWTKNFPVEVDEALMARGQERFEIYCSPCHGLGGKGDGAIAKRAAELEAAWAAPTNLTQQSVVDQAHGKIFDTITNGIRQMPGYAAQIDPEDRWAIIAYVRALQQTQTASNGQAASN